MSVKALRVLVIVISIIAGPGSAAAQRLPFLMDMPLEGVDSFDPTIPTPESVIGHVIGSRHTLPYQVEAYYRAVAAVSDRVVVYKHAESYEGQSLIHAIVTTPANHARLDAIRAQHDLLSEFPDQVSDADIAKMPAVLYQGYSVHGNESSGTEAAILYLYYLAAAQGEMIENALENSILIVEPMLNPDGRARFGNWVNSMRGSTGTTDSQDLEHNEPWPGGRTNHYWFDLNRDWMVAQHPESKGRINLYQTWRPQILTDHHEMGGSSTFFFQPGIPSRKHPNTPVENIRLTELIATYHAAGLDAIGSSYYTEEGFDDYFYGKGSAYPDINGSVGILFEQASSRALRAEMRDGELHYAFTVRNQFATSLTTLQAGVALRTKLLTYQRDFYKESRSMAQKSGQTAWVLDLERDRTKSQLLAQLLQRHRVAFHELKSDVSVGGKTIKAGNGYVIPVDQSQYRLIKSFTERTLEYEDSLFYDVSTWTLPLAFDVDLASYNGRLAGIQGELLGGVELDGGQLAGGQARHAYLLKWNRLFAPRALNRFLEAGLDARLSNEPFSIIQNGTKVWFDRGTVIIPVHSRSTPTSEDRSELVHRTVAQAVAEDHVQFVAVHSGITPDGPDIGGGSTSILSQPRIAIVAGPGANSGQAGEAWHAVSERFGLTVSMVDPSRLATGDLSRYNTIVLPGGNYSESTSSALTSWTKSGGTLIVLSGATSWANQNGLISVESKSSDPDSLWKELPYHLLNEARDAQAIAGSIFELKLDTSHPVGYGLNPNLPVFYDSSTLYEYKGSTGGMIGTFGDKPLLSGYISGPKLASLPESVGVIAVRSGQGRVIAFTNEVNHRAFWLGTQRLFFNAIFFGSSF
ncbi:MAG: M14 family metallopeptidase [Bacteroidetes bacterium]|nr:M14 family metallopeptidase [Bacteroidota bacterium]